MKSFFEKHKFYWFNKTFLVSVFVGFLFLTLSLVMNYFSVIYADSHQSNAVTDIILDNIPTFDLHLVIIEGACLVIVFVFLLVLLEPQRLPFVLKSNALFVFIRSIFISLTHIGIFPTHSIVNNNSFLNFLSLDATADLFFSGHTGMPFLLALTFWNDKNLRNLFLLISVFFGISVLLGHLHYSIDVFAAYFITYSIFCIAKKVFSSDYKFLKLGIKKI